MKHEMRGEWASRRVWLDGKELLPGPSQKIWNHSPDGFNWGYGGSGPAQLALAVCFKLTRDRDAAVTLHQLFKRDIVAGLEPHFHIVFDFDLTAKPMWRICDSTPGLLPIASLPAAPKAPAIEVQAAYPAAQPRSDQLQPRRSAQCGPCELDCYHCPDM